MKNLAVLALALTLLPAAARAQEADRPGLDKYNLKKGVAIQGYDPVAYFPAGGGAPAKGKKELRLEHRGVTYHFATEKNRDLFRAAPGRYEPSYGGWCAYAMADDDRVKIDPESFLIQDGELLLFYDGIWGNTRKKWRKEGGAQLKPKADAAWKKHSGEAAPRELSRWNLEGGLALSGYDPVLYGSGEAREGMTAHSTTYRGVTYRFTSAENLRAFQSAPARYEPALGGWAADTLAEGRRSTPDPKQFAVHDGRLLLFSSADGRTAFLENAGERYAAALRNWKATGADRQSAAR